MKNNTKIRLHVSKHLFESLTKQVIAESKKSYGAGMEEVKQPKMKTEMKMKKEEGMKMKKEEGMKHKMEETNLKEDMTSAQAGLKAITDFFGAVDPQTAVALLATLPGAALGTAMTLMGKAKQKKEKGNVKETSTSAAPLKEANPSIHDLELIASGLAAVGGLGGLIAYAQGLLQKKNPEAYKKLQGMSKAIKTADPSKNI
jgi:hypothetical protein